MTKDDKRFLAKKVIYYMGVGETDSGIITRLEGIGFKKATIKTYIKAFNQTKQP